MDFLYYFLAGFVGVYIGILAFDRLKSGSSERSRGSPAAAAAIPDESVEAAKRPTRTAPYWLKSFAIKPESVHRIVVIDKEAMSWSEADEELRAMSRECFEKGNCRGPDFAQFVVGGVVAEGLRLVFASVTEYDGERAWYGFCAPTTWAHQVGDH